MIVKLFDRTEILLDAEAGKKLEAALMRNGDGMVKLNGKLVRKSAIAHTSPGGNIGDAARDESRLLEDDNRGDEEKREAALKAAEKVREDLKKKGILKK